ncbi:hypothetical protein M23134_05248 [Microscilla marina ATCC 23134]|uniref:Uncharacterized protein n=1 Tax=Microscilla marina ATCC 23134 TaxID=313606 RepID=A1ZDK3_MICM2|nr:hypothetical protein M23134_05248 [Microscilla marina ATCC 23134]
MIDSRYQVHPALEVITGFTVRWFLAVYNTKSLPLPIH